MSVLSGRFIDVRNTSTYAPQAANLKGEVHDDVGYLSFDNARKLFVLRQSAPKASSTSLQRPRQISPATGWCLHQRPSRTSPPAWRRVKVTR